jgi:hypothetical protein
MLFGQDSSALGARERFAVADNPRAQVGAGGADAHAASATLRIRRDFTAAFVGHEDGLVRSRLTVRLLAHAAAFAGAEPAKRAVGKHRLARSEILAAAATGTREFMPVLPVTLPVALRVDGNH